MKKILFAIETILLCTIMCGCGSNGEAPSFDREMQQESATDQINEIFENSVINTRGSIGEMISAEMHSLSTVETDEVSPEECVVTVVAPDIYSLLMSALKNDIMTRDLTVDEYQDAAYSLLEEILENLENEDCSFITSKIQLQIENGQVVTNEEFVNALSGGLLQAIQELASAYMGEQ